MVLETTTQWRSLLEEDEQLDWPNSQTFTDCAP